MCSNSSNKDDTSNTQATTVPTFNNVIMLHNPNLITTPSPPPPPQTLTTTINASHIIYINDFRVEQCQLFLQHKCTQHRPYTCFYWHFMNQRRRRPHLYADGSCTYDCNIYCDLYDEQTGICSNGDECPFVHRNSGDTERRYHPKYYKTAWCTFETDMRGNCVKNGAHCALAHSPSDTRSICVNGSSTTLDSEHLQRSQYIISMLDKDRQANDDPSWNDPIYVLEWYKTEPCQRPARVCRQGYACPQYHNARDRRRNPFFFTYRSNPCSKVKQTDEWNDPSSCENGDNCGYCHTRTEQQFHPEIYKTTKCNDIVQHRYCPRGTFCAFAHSQFDFKDIRDPRITSSHIAMLAEHYHLTPTKTSTIPYSLLLKSRKSTTNDQYTQAASTASTLKNLQSSNTTNDSLQLLSYGLSMPSNSQFLHNISHMSPATLMNTKYEPKTSSTSSLQTPIEQQNRQSFVELCPAFQKKTNESCSQQHKSSYNNINSQKNDDDNTFNRATATATPWFSGNDGSILRGPPPGLLPSRFDGKGLMKNEYNQLISNHNVQLSSSFACLSKADDDDKSTFQHQNSLEQMISKSLENIGIKTSSPIYFGNNEEGCVSSSEKNATINNEKNNHNANKDQQLSFTPVSLSPTGSIGKKYLDSSNKNLLYRRTELPNFSSYATSIGEVLEKFNQSTTASPPISSQLNKKCKYRLDSDPCSNILLTVPKTALSLSYDRSCASSPTNFSLNRHDRTGSDSPNDPHETPTFIETSSKIMDFAQNARLQKEIDWLQSKVKSLEQCIYKQQKALEMMQDHIEKCSKQSNQMETERDEALMKYEETASELYELKKIHNKEAARIWSDQVSTDILDSQMDTTNLAEKCFDDIHWTNLKIQDNNSEQEKKWMMKPNQFLKPYYPYHN